MAEEILDIHGDQIDVLELLPSFGGIFEVVVGDTQVFSKKKTGRFPEAGEAPRLVGENLG